MHYKTRTYLNEAVIVRSTGCDMNEVWSMYLKIEKCRVTRQHVICLAFGLLAPLGATTMCLGPSGFLKKLKNKKQKKVIMPYTY